jgi:transcriptional regulator with XRE-family HTH domain
MTVTAMGLVPEWDLSDRLRKSRLLVGMTQKEFAQMLNISVPSYTQWECGNNGPRNVVQVAQTIQAVTGISAAWILGLDLPPEIGPGMPMAPHSMSERPSNQVAGTGFEPVTSGLWARHIPLAPAA